MSKMAQNDQKGTKMDQKKTKVDQNGLSKMKQKDPAW